MRRALVTGGNRGIGKAICEGLARAGLEVIVGARDVEAGRMVADAIGGSTVALDVADRGSIAKAVGEVGDIDVLVNNAGILNRVELLGQHSDFDAAMAVMVRGPFDLMRAFLPGMSARRYGRVVNLSSGWGSFAEGMGGPGAYGVAKAALNALTVATAREAGAGVKINSMCPGWVHTDMGGPDAPRTPEEGADTAIWLATLDDDGPTGGFFRRRERIEW